MTLTSFSLPLSSPLGTAAGRITERDGFLYCRDGGVGEASPLPGWTESAADCRRALEAADETRDWEAARAACEDAPAARHAVSQAALDARARSKERPLYRELGGERTVDSVPVNATVGDASLDGTLDSVRTAVDRGFSTVKLKVGARHVEADVDRVRALRDAHPDLDIRVDANGMWSDADARRFIDSTVAVDLEYVEQPVDSLDGLSRLAKRAPVAADESVVEHGVRACLDAGVSAVVLKPMALGGLEQARKAALDATEAGVTPVVSNTIDAAYARVGAVHLAASLPDPAPGGLATGDRLARDLVPDATPVSDGRVAVPSGNGNGIAASRGQ